VVFLFSLFSKSVRNQTNKRKKTLHIYKPTRVKTQKQSVVLAKFNYSVRFFFIYMSLCDIRKSEVKTIKFIVPFFSRKID
jgi:hypothetical protein